VLTDKKHPQTDDEPANAREALRKIEAQNLSEFDRKRKTLQATAEAAKKFEATLHEADAAAQGAD
jgi:hypothetical protein